MTEKLDESSPGKDESAAAANNSNDNDHHNQSATGNCMASLKNDILDFLCRNNEVHFKSQQIDDPELTMDEKKTIAREILEQNRGKFLIRFGKYLQSEHLNYFEAKENVQVDGNGDYDDRDAGSKEQDFEVKFLVKDLRKNLEHKHKSIKNRRYAAMQAMIKENNYFSEKEMMQREPYLYEQLVGQYLTEAEKHLRDGYDPKNTPLSNILLYNMDKERMDELRKKQENEEQMSDDTSHSSRTSSQQNSEDLFPRTPPAFRRQWGNFDSESDSQEQATTSKKSKHKQGGRGRKQEAQQKLITAGEREMLRQEFLGIMYSKFLEGEDKDFDYSKVDNNADLDDLKQIGQDNEDEYFDGSDEDDDDEGVYTSNIDRMDEDMESEDDLDIYMKHLNQHPTLQQK